MFLILQVVPGALKPISDGAVLAQHMLGVILYSEGTDTDLYTDTTGTNQNRSVSIYAGADTATISKLAMYSVRFVAVSPIVHGFSIK